jgi:hypothetical protein
VGGCEATELMHVEGVPFICDMAEAGTPVVESKNEKHKAKGTRKFAPGFEARRSNFLKGNNTTNANHQVQH